MVAPDAPRRQHADHVAHGNITLTTPGNSFNTVTFTGGNIAWQEANAVTIGSVSANAGATSTGALTITATGQQWLWRYEYPVKDLPADVVLIATGATPGRTFIRCRRHTACTSLKRVP